MKKIAFILFMLCAALTVPVQTMAQKTITLECFRCEQINKKDCDFCKSRTVSKQYLDGLMVRYNNRPAQSLQKPFDVWTKGRSVFIKDVRGIVVEIPSKKTPYGTVQAVLDIVFECQKPAGGGGTTDYVSSVDLVADSILSFGSVGLAFSGAVNLSPLIDGNDIDYVSSVSLNASADSMVFLGQGNAFTGSVPVPSRPRVSTVASILSRDSLQNVGRGDVAIIDSIDICLNRGVSHYDGSGWTNPLVIIAAEDNRSTIYVDKNGQNPNGKKGDAHCPFYDPIYAKDSTAVLGDRIDVQTGIYQWGTDVPTGGGRNSYQLAKAGEHINYTLQNGAVFTAADVADPFGFGFGAGAELGVKLVVDGYGDFIVNNSGGTTRGIPAFGSDSEVYFKGRSLTTTGTTFSIATSCSVANFNFDYLYTEDAAYLSLSNTGVPYQWTRSIEVDKCRVVNSANTGTFKHQLATAFLPGTTDRIVVGDIHISGGATGTAYLADFGDPVNIGRGGSFSFEAGNIYNDRFFALKYPDFLISSNLTQSAEIHYTGGGVEVAAESSWVSEVESINSPAPAFQMNGFYLTDYSQCRVDLGTCITTQGISTGLFDPHILDNSKLYVTGKFVNTTTDQPCAMLYFPNVDSSSLIVYENVRFEVPINSTKAVVQIASDGTYPNGARVVFKNCEFIGNPNLPAVQTNNLSVLEVSFYYCITNSQVADPLIQEKGTTLVRDLSVK